MGLMDTISTIDFHVQAPIQLNLGYRWHRQSNEESTNIVDNFIIKSPRISYECSTKKVKYMLTNDLIIWLISHSKIS